MVCSGRSYLIPYRPIPSPHPPQVYDKGTSYGLAQPGARVKSILVSLPATVQFAYDDDAAALPGTHEAATIAALKTPRDWAAAATAAKRAL
jgi:hypothetical protein